MKNFKLIIGLLIGIFFPSIINAGDLIKISSEAYSIEGETATAVEVDSAGNIYMAGHGIVGGGDSDPCYIIKYDRDYIQKGLVAIEINNIDSNGQGITIDKDGNIIVVGYTNNGTDDDWFVLKYNSVLSTLLSSATFINGGSSGENDRAHDVVTDRDGNIYVTGSKWDLGNSDKDYFTIKYDSNLVMVSSAIYVGSGGQDDISYGIDIGPSGHIYTTGVVYRASSLEDFFTIKYDSNLIPVSSASFKTPPPSQKDYGRDIKTDPSGNVYVAGYHHDGDGIMGNIITLKYDSDLTLISSATIKIANDYNFAYGLDIDPEGNVIVVGMAEDAMKQAFALRYDNNLILVSSQIITNSNYPEEFNSVVTDETGNIFTTGAYAGKLFVLKYNGLPVINSVSPNSTEMVNALQLSVTGNNYITGLQASVSEPGITVNNLVVNSKISATLNISIGSDVSAGSYSITFTNPDGAVYTKSSALTITVPADEIEQEPEEIEIVEEIGDIKILGSTERRGIVNPDKGDVVEVFFKGLRDGIYKLKIFTLLGELVYEDEKESIKEGKFTWIPEDIASGIYLISMKGPGVNIHKKIAILR